MIAVLVVAGACGSGEGNGEGGVEQADGSGPASSTGSTGSHPSSPGSGSCPTGPEVLDGGWSGEVTSAVGEDDPEVAGVGDPGFADLGDPATDVGHYHLDLTVDPATGAIEAGVADVELTAVRDVDEVSFDLVGLTVGAVAVDGRPVSARRDGARLVVPAELATGDEATVTVCYSGVPTPVPTEALGGVPVGWQRGRDGLFVLAEPEGARTWFPVDDHPTDKATFTVEVTVPEGWVALSNGVGGRLEDDGGRGGDGEATFRWAMRQPMAPYLATVLVGRYEEHEVAPVDDVAVDVWAVAGAPGRAVEALLAQGEVLAVLVELFGPYPFDDLGSALLPGAATEDDLLDRVALEAQALSIYGIGSVSEATLVHETAHQWFGNSVSLTSWTRDLWWVEGMATFAQWLHAEEVHGRDAYDEQVAVAERTVGGTDGEIGDLDPTDLFGPLAYQGGALVFADLRAELGDEAFLEVLRTFLDRHRHGNATTADLVTVASEVADRDLADVFDAWLGPAEERPATVG